MSSALVIHKKPAKEPSVFDECVVAQKRSSDIVIYSNHASQIVTVTWPSYRGIKVVPTGIKEWLHARGLHWACFCGMTAPPGVHLSSQIVHATSGDVLVFCHNEPTTCGFFLNLSEIFESARHTSNYLFLHKNNQLQEATRNDGAELVNLQLAQLVASEVAPYLKGYCGDSVPGIEQMSSSRQYISKSAKTVIRRQPRASLPTILPNASTSTLAAAVAIDALPSNSSPDIQSAPTQLADQCQAIVRLMKGEGLEWFEWDDLVETCSNCQKTFLQVFFKAHVEGCWAE